MFFTKKYLFIVILILFQDVIEAKSETVNPIGSDENNKKIKNDDKEENIMNGRNAKEGELPYQVAIRENTKESRFRCGGIIVTQWIVMTAGHCIFESDVGYSLIIAAGTTRLDDIKWRVLRRVVSFVRPPQYKFPEYDIALLRVDNKFLSTNRLTQPIGITICVIQKGTLCQISGWGETHEKHKKTNNVNDLQVAFTEIKECEYEDAWMEKEKIICGKYPGVGCKGDSGGPLVCNGKLAGIISGGLEPMLTCSTNFYTTLHFHSNWLRQNGVPVPSTCN